MDVTALDQQARKILRGNDRGGYTVPTDGLYPYQWNWDSAFAAWGFAQFDVERAWAELETLVSGQWSNGMIPHILFHKPDPGYFPGPDVWGTEGKGPVLSSGITQPPVAATFALATHEADPEAGLPRLRALYPKLRDWHRWFMTWRCEDGMIFVTHPWEAGRDNCPDWDTAMAAIDPVGVGEYTRRDTSHVDPAMRPTKEDYDRYIWLVQRGKRLGWDDAAMADDMPFKVADPTMTFILLRACRDLGRMADLLGEDRAEIDGWIDRLTEGAGRLRNGKGVFDAINLNTGAHSGHLSCASYLCWYAGIESEDMLACLDKAFEDTPYTIPSHAFGTEEFNPKRYWRGPIWGILNTLTGIGLAEMGHEDRAARLRRATADLIAEHGFAEYFDPLTGEPAGGGTFTWTAAIWLAWASPSAGGA
ncbi:MGH1-like glycoside hydrolase domain-containing protein [Palleronia caenipelagi]|uniref:Mannosylglycerate hydrolase MGH1-like glycoside hydrolase domain-containing protein n=1 Tax=Palleronia caenipelagi TaxID=2489174 RepID=A0A547Q919_9RHOB|nr:hypothetical protein [Palleronia caenipelagi]TRD22853.1 hypothetical protein FEV53_03510 [Palleronia caenipelagi]